eukprot:2602332-Prymnesium_polylepis.1
MEARLNVLGAAIEGGPKLHVPAQSSMAGCQVCRPARDGRRGGPPEWQAHDVCACHCGGPP